MGNKICTKCGIEKSLDDFYSDKRTTDGKQSSCKKCYKKCCKKYREEHKEERKIKAVKYNDEHKKEHKEYYKENKERILIRVKKYREEHKEEIKKSLEKHREKKKIYQKKYKIEHKKERSKYQAKRRKTDIRYRISVVLRSRIRHAIKGNTKSLPTMMLIGCETDYLLYHLQSQFTKGMSWDNHGEWHIDHIKPCIKFDLSKPEEQRKCFHYSNLQPLWAKDNLLKSDKYNENVGL